jgi:putative transposase
LTEHLGYENGDPAGLGSGNSRNGSSSKTVLSEDGEQTEGAKFWLKVVNELKARGIDDILIAVVDGLKGFPEAITSVYPLTTVQTGANAIRRSVRLGAVRGNTSCRSSPSRPAFAR